MLGLLDTVRGVIDSAETLRTWGDYAMTRASLADGLRDSGPLGADDLKSLVAAVEHAAVPAKRRYGLASPIAVYTAVGSRLRELPGATELFKGVGYAAAVCRTNLALADAVRRDSDHGLFDNGARVTLDDAFESGGVWRSCYPGNAEPMGDPLSPLGRGWTSTLPAPPEPDTELAPVDLPLPDETLLGPGKLVRTDAQEIVWRSPLRLVHLIGGWFPTHTDVARELCRRYGRSPAMRFELCHAGETLDEHEVAQDVAADLGDETGRLTAVRWPRSFFPGLMLELCWSRGSSVVRAMTVRIEDPVQFGDRVIGHCYDPRVLTREDAPGSDRHGDSAVGLGPRQLVMRTVRRCGLLTLDGHALLDRTALPRAAYGRPPARSQVAALEGATTELLAERVLEPALGSRDAWGQPQFPARREQPTVPLIGYHPVERPVPRPWGGTEHDDGYLHGVQFVPGHLRRLRPGCSPSDVQRTAFREHCRRLGKADGWELPHGYTFVTDHTRGH